MSDPKDLAEALRRAGTSKEKQVKEAATAEKAAPARPASKKAAPRSLPPKPTRTGVAAAARSTATATQEESAVETRRGFLVGLLLVSWVAIGWTAFVTGMGVFLAMLGRFMFPNVLAEPPSTVKVGLPTNFEPDQVNEAWKAEWGFWIVRSADYDGVDKIYAIQTVCTHLGCPPNWLPSDQKFKCPCHGSGFYISGVNFEGPAPRPLERFRIAIADDGQLLVDKSQKFQEELGQWNDPDSFIPV